MFVWFWKASGSWIHQVDAENLTLSCRAHPIHDVSVTQMLWWVSPRHLIDCRCGWCEMEDKKSVSHTWSYNWFTPCGGFAEPGPSDAAVDLAWNYSRGVARPVIRRRHCSGIGSVIGLIIYGTPIMLTSSWGFWAFDSLCWSDSHAPKPESPINWVVMVSIFFEGHSNIILLHFEAAALDVIHNANSIIDYDQRDTGINSCPTSRICPVLGALYRGDEKHTVTWYWFERLLHIYTYCFSGWMIGGWMCFENWIDMSLSFIVYIKLWPVPCL